MPLFFTADTHFGHAAIIDLCDRPFSSVDEMDEVLISRWNETVASSDTVYHLGDFCFRAKKTAADYLARLNGSIHLIVGNHDDEAIRHADKFVSVNHFLEIRAARQHVVLCHYPLREWHGAWRGSWHLFGHVHGRLNHEPLGFSLDVGVDSHDFRPWHIDEIATLMQTRENPFQGGHRPKPVQKTP